MTKASHTTFPDAVAMQTLEFEAPQRAAALMACSPDCIKLLSPDGCITYLSHNGLCALEIDDLSTVLGQAWRVLWPAEARHLIDGALSGAQAGQTARFIEDCPTAKGKYARWDVTVQGVFDPDGTLTEIVAVSRHTRDPKQALRVF